MVQVTVKMRDDRKIKLFSVTQVETSDNEITLIDRSHRRGETGTTEKRYSIPLNEPCLYRVDTGERINVGLYNSITIKPDPDAICAYV